MERERGPVGDRYLRAQQAVVASAFLAVGAWLLGLAITAPSDGWPMVLPGGALALAGLLELRSRRGPRRR